MKTLSRISFCLSFLLVLSTESVAIDEYRLDDGLKESAWGASSAGTGGISFAWLNRFVAEAGKETITDIRIAFGGDANNPNHINVADGTPVTFYLWYDFNQDSDPASSIVVAQFSDVVANSGTNQLNTYSFPTPHTFNPGDSFFAGAIINNLPNPQPPTTVLVGSLDEDGTDEPPGYPPNLHSFVAANSQGIPVNPNALGLAMDPVDQVSNVLPLPSCPQPSNCNGDGSWMIRLNAVSATGPGSPVLQITPASLDFGPSRVGEFIGPLGATLINTGTGNLSVTDISAPASPFFYSSFVPGNCGVPPFTLLPGNSCTINYSFAPTVANFFTENIIVTSNTSGPPAPPLLIQGLATDVLIELIPNLIDFGDVPVGTSSTRTLMVSNSNIGAPNGFALGVLGLQDLGGGAPLPPEFNVLPGSCGPFPFTLDYLDNCELIIEFSPTATGPLVHDNELINDATAGDGTFSLVGNGIPFQPGVLEIDPPPDPVTGVSIVDLGATLIGQVSPAGTATLLNNGPVDLNVNISFSVISFIFVVNTGTCSAPSFTLAPGESCQLSFVFSPMDHINHVGDLSFNVILLSNSSSSPDIIQLLGHGLEVPLFQDRFEQ